MSRAIVKAAAADMEMVEAAISAAAEAMEQTYYETEYAAFVTARMREKYKNCLWHCFCGRNFGAYVTSEKGKFMYFYIGQTGFLVFGTVV